MFQRLRYSRHIIAGLLLAWGMLWINTHLGACGLGGGFDQTVASHCEHPCCEHQGGDHHTKAIHPQCPVMLADALQAEAWLPLGGHLGVSLVLPAPAFLLPTRIPNSRSGAAPGFAWTPQEHPALRYRALLN